MEVRRRGGRPGDEREIGQEVGHLLHHALEGLRGDLAVAVPLGQRHDPDGQGIPGADALARIGRRVRRDAVEPGDLRRAAADVEDDHRLRIRVGEGGAARHGEIRFRPAIDDLELEPELVLNAVDEGRAVGGEAAGFGRDHAGPGDAARLDLLLADMQRLEGAPDGALAQAVAVPEPLAETDDAGEGVDDPEADMRGLGDQETAIVCAEVESRIGRAAATAGAPERPTQRFGLTVQRAAGRHIAGRGRELAPVRAGVQNSLVLDLHGRISFGRRICISRLDRWRESNKPPGCLPRAKLGLRGDRAGAAIMPQAAFAPWKATARGVGRSRPFASTKVRGRLITSSRRDHSTLGENGLAMISLTPRPRARSTT